MQVVINIDENLFTKLFDCGVYDAVDMLNVCTAVRKGTPLPKPFDLEGLKSDMKALNYGYPYGLDYLLDCLKKRLGIIIIETDKIEGDDEK